MPIKTFDNEWIFRAFEDHSSFFFTKRMFGGLAAYLLGRQMMVLVEPTMERVAAAVARDDRRFGIQPGEKRRRT